MGLHSCCISIGIGLHNFGEGLAIGAAVGIGSMAFSTFLIVGFSSNFTEGYQNFTADDTLMLENVKQAITYAKQNKFIPNIDNSIKSQAQMPQDMEMMNKYMDKNPSNNNTLPTGNNINQSLNTEYTMPPSKQINNITMPTKNINNMPSMPTKNINNMPPIQAPKMAGVPAIIPIIANFPSINFPLLCFFFRRDQLNWRKML